MRKQQPSSMPDPAAYRGRPLGLYLHDLLMWLKRFVEHPGTGGKPPTILVYTQAGGISARSGTTPGSGTVNIVTWNGTELDNSGNGTLNAFNAYGAAFAGSKYVLCVLWKNEYWAATQEC
jgi:hypothetical protein